MSGPLLKTLQHRRRLTFPEIPDPAFQILGQFFGHPFDADTPRPARQFPNPLLKSKNRLRRDPPLWLPIAGEAEAQKLPLPWSRYRTLLLVHLELQLRRDERRKARHHSFPGPPATNVDIAIVRVPRKPKSSPLQLPIELVKHDIAQQG